MGAWLAILVWVAIPMGGCWWLWHKGHRRWAVGFVALYLVFFWIVAAIGLDFCAFHTSAQAVK
jgi:hypothetical protein